MTMPDDHLITVRQVLWKLAAKHNVLFTIESAMSDRGPIDPIEAQMVQVPAEQSDLGQELSQLKQGLPNLVYEIRGRSRPVVYLMDSRLLGQKGYALDQIVPSIDFTGRGSELVTAIAKQGIRVSPPVVVDLSEQQDHTTIFHATGKNLRVRDVRSDFVPPDAPSGVLWVARTKIGDAEVSYILFRYRSRPHS